MTTPQRFQNLPQYAFPRLRTLLDSHPPGCAPGEVVSMSIGEPQHPFPDWVEEVIAEEGAAFGRYPPSEGAPELLEAMAGWLARRYGVQVAPERLTVTAGSREGLFMAGVALCPEEKRGARPVALIPNPFYQVYAASSLAAQAQPVFIPTSAANGFRPDLDAIPAPLLDRTALFWICSPANPQGAVADRAYYARLLELAAKHDFKVLADECYSEIWRDAPPPGILQVAQERGADPERVLAFNSLSKRSNLPGLRVGMTVAGPRSMEKIRRLRAYAGADVPLPLQRVATRAWADEAHVEASRALYAQKFDLLERLFAGHPQVRAPEGGFFLWMPAPAGMDDEAAALKLWREGGVRVLPGSYLGRAEGIEGLAENPGRGWLRVALVAPLADVERGLCRIRDCLL